MRNAFGELLVLALYQKYQQEGSAFVAALSGTAGVGAARMPHMCCWAKLGVDVTDPAFWELGFEVVGPAWSAMAEELAAKL